MRKGLSRRPLLNASAPHVLQLGPNAQNRSMHVWHELTLRGTLVSSHRLDHREDRLSDVFG